MVEDGLEWGSNTADFYRYLDDMIVKCQSAVGYCNSSLPVDILSVNSNLFKSC